MNKQTFIRLRRLRTTKSLRDLVGLSQPKLEKFVWPIFVTRGRNVASPIPSLPGQHYYSADRVCRALEDHVKQGLGGVLLFGVVDHKTASGTEAYRDTGPVHQAIRQIRRHFPDLTVFTDVCLCEYTQSGHCAVLGSRGEPVNDRTLPILGKIAVSHAAAGAHGVAPSSMMDGKVQAIRRSLNAAGFAETIIMSYSSKFASSMYGPFREAAHSSPQKADKRAYQLSPNDPRQAIRASLRDEEEGADILMVKPSLFYLDIVSQLRQQTHLPIAAYNVSGEYCMLVASADRGCGDLYQMANEALCAISRAGADFIITYWANQYAHIFPEYGHK
jgi:porphobilinogen synthase